MSPSPPTLAKLTDLPHELLPHIIDPLDDESIYALAKTLHFFALPLFLSRDGIHFPTPDTVSISNPSNMGLSALQTSLFAGKLQNISISASREFFGVFPDFCTLRRLLTRMPWIRSLSVTFSSLHYLCRSDLQQLSEEFSAFVDEALHKSCQSLYVYGGDGVPHMCAATQELPESNQERNALGVRKTVPAGRARSRLLSNFLKTKNYSKPFHSDLFHHSSLSSFHISSPILLQPPFLNWIISSLQANAASVTHLRFHEIDANVSSFTWHQLLPTLTLPSLRQFELTCDKLTDQTEVDFSDIEAFLRRSPSIQNLDLSGIIIPNRTSRLRIPILPELYVLQAHPKVITWLLSRKRHFRKLMFVTVRSESGEFDYDQFDEALEAIARYSRRDISLGLDFVSENGVFEWMWKHISNSLAPSGGLSTDLTWVVNLSIDSNHWLRLDHRGGPVAGVLPRFLALFPRLVQVDFREQLWDNDMEEFKASFLKEIMLSCPKLTIVCLNSSPVDLTNWFLL